MAEIIPPYEQLRSLLEMLREAQARADERAKVTHERFNVFTTLLELHDEVRLHTRFLECLLNPKGSHDCGTLFLNLFFDTLAEHHGKDHANKPVQLYIPRSEKHWSVEKEAPREGFGQIDLLLEQTGFGIAIENKIYANEQEEQLARYASYLEKRHGEGSVLYLTLDGKQSKTHAGKIQYVRISYADHILTWLEQCLRETHDIIPINQVLLQYRAVVRGLIGKNIDSKFMNDIVKFITQYPDIIRFQKQIDEGIKEARARFLDCLADEIRKELETNHGFSVTLRPKRFGGDCHGGLILTPPVNSTLHKAPFKIHVENDREQNALIVGIVTETWHSKLCSQSDTGQTSAADNSLFQRMDELLKIYPSDRDYHKHKADGNWPTGWHNLIEGIYDERLATLLDPKTSLAETVSKICEGIKKHLALLEKIYLKAIQPTNIQL